MNTDVNQHKYQNLITLLKYTFVIVPIAAGFDKFLNLLADWEMYLHPAFAEIIPFSTSVFMIIVGIIEIAAGFIVLKWTRLGAYIVAVWLLLISLNLLFSGQYLDVAVRDIVMAVSAYVLAGFSDILSDDGSV